MTTKKKAIAVAAAIVVAAVAVVYVRWSLTPCSGCHVLQTRLATCTPELLAEKKPIVIQDRVVDHRKLLDTVFKYQFIMRKDAGGGDGGSWGGDAKGGMATVSTTTDARFTLFYDPRADFEVDLVHPSDKSVIARVRVPSGMTIVVPPLWRCIFARSPQSATRRCIRLYDTFFTTVNGLGLLK